MDTYLRHYTLTGTVQTKRLQARRDDEKFAFVSAWEWAGLGQDPILHKEALTFDYVHLTQRSYK